MAAHAYDPRTQHAEAGLPILGQPELHGCLRAYWRSRQHIWGTKAHSALESLRLSEVLSGHLAKGTLHWPQRDGDKEGCSTQLF